MNVEREDDINIQFTICKIICDIKYIQFAKSLYATFNFYFLNKIEEYIQFVVTFCF